MRIIADLKKKRKDWSEKKIEQFEFEKKVKKNFIQFKKIEQKFVGLLLKKGDRASALKIWFKALLLLRMQFKRKDISLVVQKSINNIKPVVILKSRKLGGTLYQIPYLLQNKKRDNSLFLSLRWIISVINVKDGRSISLKLAKELKNAYFNKGVCVKKKNDIYKAALQNRIYIRFLFSRRRKRRSYILKK